MEARIAEEKREAAKVELVEVEAEVDLVVDKSFKVEEVIENSVSGESRRGGEDKVLDDLEKVVSKIYENSFFVSFYPFISGGAEDLREVRG